jgi:hypothetical protein
VEVKITSAVGSAPMSQPKLTPDKFSDGICARCHCEPCNRSPQYVNPPEGVHEPTIDIKELEKRLRNSEER